MLVPLLLIAGATLCAAVVACGTQPALVGWPHGLQIILWTRLLQWPLVALAIIFCIALGAWVIGRARRPWWLLGLTPVLVLFAHRFAAAQAHTLAILENPPFLETRDVGFLSDEDWVVAVEFSGEAWAFPYAALYAAPVVIVADHNQRMIVLWSAFANRAVAAGIDHSIRARELEIVSTPANALLLYDSRVGQFINGATGRTPRGENPKGFRAGLPVSKVLWKTWRAAHAEGRVMAPQAGLVPQAGRPLLPYYPVPLTAAQPPAQTRIVMIAATQPVAVPVEAIGSTPLNLTAGALPILLFRDAAGQVRALDRRIEDDLAPRFRPNTNPRRAVAWVDADTGSGWSREGVALDGPLARRGVRLKPVVGVDDGLYWSVMKYWYPTLQLVSPPADARGR